LDKSNQDSQFESHKQLQDLISNLSDVLNAGITNAPNIETEGLAGLLVLISNIVSECQNHFSQYLSLLIEFKYYSEKTDIYELRKKMDFFTYNFQNRTHENFCYRLKGLRNNYKSLVVPELLKANIEKLEDWLEYFFKMENFRYNYLKIERMIYFELFGTLTLVDNSKSKENHYELVRKKAASYIKVLNNHLRELQNLNNQILGLSGKTGFLELVNIPERLQQQVSVTMIDKNTNYDLKGSKFGGGFAAEGGIQTGGTLIDVSSTNNLTEAAQQIQELLQQLQTQGMNENEAQKQAAQDLAKQAEQNPTLMGKLIQWSKSMADTASKTTVSEATKGVVQLALGIAGISLP
jgi:hypothetical protein